MKIIKSIRKLKKYLKKKNEIIEIDELNHDNWSIYSKNKNIENENIITFNSKNISNIFIRDFK